MKEQKAVQESTRSTIESTLEQNENSAERSPKDSQWKGGL